MSVSLENSHQIFHLIGAGFRVAVLENLLYAVLDMVGQKVLSGFIQGTLDRCDLNKHIQTGAIFLKHTMDSANLALCTLKPREYFFLPGGILHNSHYTPRGYHGKSNVGEYQQIAPLPLPTGGVITFWTRKQNGLSCTLTQGVESRC
jgi:hypothetical protein